MRWGGSRDSDYVPVALRRRRGEVPQLLAFEAPVTSDRIPLDLAMLSEEQRNPVR